MAGLARLVGIGFVGSLAVTLMLLGCILPGKWWPLLVIVFYIFTPLPLLFASGNAGYESLDGESNKARDLAIFCCTGMIVSTIAFPILLTRAPIDNPRLDATGCILTELATICVYVTCGLFAVSFNEEDE